jgi:hypothetical protein
MAVKSYGRREVKEGSTHFGIRSWRWEPKICHGTLTLWQQRQGTNGNSSKINLCSKKQYIGTPRAIITFHKHTLLLSPLPPPPHFPPTACCTLAFTATFRHHNFPQPRSFTTTTITCPARGCVLTNLRRAEASVSFGLAANANSSLRKEGEEGKLAWREEGRQC